MQNQHEPYFDYQLIDPKTSEVVATIKALDGVEALMLFRPEYKWAAAKPSRPPHRLFLVPCTWVRKQAR